MGLFDFHRQLDDYASPDPASVESAGEAGARHAAYHRRVYLCGCVFAVLGMALGIVVAIAARAEAAPTGRTARGVWLAPLAGLMGGFFLGVSVACLFAPRAFLTGPVGKKWMKLIGTRSVVTARVACLLFVLASVAVMVGLTVMLSLSK
jgi:hypothetical protein